MKSVKKDVRSGGKVIGKVEIQTFENIKEAITTLKEEKVLELVNRQNASDTMNVFRAAKTSTTSPTAQLTRLAKTNPELQKAIESLISKYAAAAA